MFDPKLLRLYAVTDRDLLALSRAITEGETL